MEILVLPFRLLYAKKNSSCYMRLFIIGCFMVPRLREEGPPPHSGIILIVFFVEFIDKCDALCYYCFKPLTYEKARPALHGIVFLKKV